MPQIQENVTHCYQDKSKEFDTELAYLAKLHPAKDKAATEERLFYSTKETLLYRKQ